MQHFKISALIEIHIIILWRCTCTFYFHFKITVRWNWGIKISSIIWLLLSFDQIFALLTSAFRRLGPVPIASALCSFITKQHIWRQTLVRPPGAIASGVPADFFVINDCPKTGDRSEATLHSFSRKQSTMIYESLNIRTCTSFFYVFFTHQITYVCTLGSGCSTVHWRDTPRFRLQLGCTCGKPAQLTGCKQSAGDNDCIMSQRKNMSKSDVMIMLMFASPLVTRVVDGALVHRVHVVQISVQQRLRIGASLCCRRGLQNI